MKIINLGILAHVDAGKTTLTEQMLVLSGAKKAVGRVDDGTTTTDYLALEKKRGMTIRASTVSFEHMGAKINLIDTPGHMEFIAEVERSLAVLNGAVLVVSAREGVQSQTRVIYAKLREMAIPTILFVNKIDRVGASIERTLNQVKTLLGARAVDMREDGLKERLAGESDALLEKYVADEPVGAADIDAFLTAEMRRGLMPAYAGAALRGEGVQSVMDAAARLFSGGGDTGAPLSALVYKSEWMGDKERRVYLRVFSGVLPARAKVSVVGLDAPVMIRTLTTPRHGDFVPVGSVPAGDIAMIPFAEEMRSGDFVGERMELPGFKNEQPLLTAVLKEKSGDQRPKLIEALKKLNEEDPSLKFTINERTGELCIRLFGALQREILDGLLRERFSLEADFSELMTIYTDHPTQAATAHLWFNEAGNLHEAGIELRVEPLPPGSGAVYESQVSPGDLTRPFLAAVELGVRAGMVEGLGYEVVDAKVTFTDMQFSSVTSTPADFRRLAPLVLKKALECAALQRMEPWISFSATVPSDAQKKLLLLIGKRRATIADVVYTDTECTAKGEAPLDDMKDFASEVAMLSKGEGLTDVRFLAYRKYDL